jgi:SAM-dependent methyltransferase
MTAETSGKAAADALAQSFARALEAFEATDPGSPRRTSLPHPFSNLSREQWARSISLWREHGAPLLREVPARPCPTCGGTKSDHIFQSYDAYPYHECMNCRTWFVPLEITHVLFERYFEAVPEARKFGDYTDSQAVETAAVSADRARFDGYYAALKSCLARCGAPVSTLDVGCGVANSLVVATEHGFEAEGIEVNRHAVTLARKLGRQVTFPEEPTRAKAFDAVTMWETLEHISAPLTALQEARERLKLDGLLALSVPNLNAPDIRWMRGDSLQIHGGPAWPGHINLWTPKTLALLLRRAGFEPMYMAGQFSTNLEELAAYSLGEWSGARDYLRIDSPEFELPFAASNLAQSLGPAVISWQEGFAFAPILFVLARRSDGSAPSGLAAHTASVADARRRSLAITYRLQHTPPGPRRRGQVVNLADSEWRAEGISLAGDRLQIDATDSEPFSYLWRSQPIDAPTGALIRVRGVLLSGGLSAGLLEADCWTAQESATSPGPFELTLRASPEAIFNLIICNNDNGGGPALADIDCVEIVDEDKNLP